MTKHVGISPVGDRPAMLKCKALPANSARDADIKMG